MKTTDLPRWRQMFSPTGSEDELTELKAALSHSTACRTALENFLYAEWATMSAMARCERDPQDREMYRQAANALAETAGKIFSPKRKKTTESRML